MVICVMKHPPTNTCRLLVEQTLFCDTIMQALALTDEDMGSFNSDYAKNKAEQGRLLKAKFSVSSHTDLQP